LSRRVLAVDTVAARRDLALALGATDVADPREVGDLPEPPAVVLEVSGTPPGLETALAIVRPQGRVALVGSQQRLDRFDLFWPLQNSGARIVPLYREGAASVQSPAGNPAQRWLPLIHDFLLRGWLRIEPLITWVVSPELAPAAFELLRRRPELAVGMAIAWDPTVARDDAAVATLSQW
jgi:threonine dehydrogenase-like Zn-dependent dehydrogenase